MHTGGPKSAGNEKAAAKGPARYQDARGPSAGQVTPAVACPWAGAATCRGKRVVSTPSNKSLGTSLARFGARATTACPVVSVCSRNLPAQVPTKPSSLTTYRRQQRSRRAMERVCRSRALSQIWARLQCDQLVSSVEDLNAECGPARYAWCGEAAENLSHENARPSVRVRLCE